MTQVTGNAAAGGEMPPPRISAAARWGGLKAGERRVGLLFLAPALIAFATVIAWPFLRALGYAFTRYDLQTPVPRFIGFDNFRMILSTPARPAAHEPISDLWPRRERARHRGCFRRSVGAIAEG